MRKIVLFTFITTLFLVTPITASSHDHEHPGSIDIPKLNMRGFADMGYSVWDAHGKNDNTFSVNEVGLFITSNIAEKLTFVLEAEFHPDPDTNDVGFHTERVNIKYSLSDLLNIKIGRMHTPLGYWNQTYHHGTWLQTTIARPMVYTWEDDDGGFLPVHSVGIELLGTMEMPGFDLSYNMDVLNGRGRTIEEVQNIEDKNDSKAINFLLSLKPHIVQGLRLGGNIYLDTIPPNSGDSSRTGRIEERIVGGHLVFIHDGMEFIGEGFNIYHDDKTSGNKFDTFAFYLQVAYQVNDFKPYYRYDFMETAYGDPFFTPHDIDIEKHTFGMRWDIFPWNALKFEFSLSDRKNSVSEHLISPTFTINSSFAF